MLRRITYRDALTGLFFAGLWFILGLLLLFSGFPSRLGIGREMFTAWLLLFFAISAVSGAMLTLAAVNGIWPPVAKPPRRPAARAAAGRATPGVQPGSPAAAQADGAPLPWSASPLPQRGRRTG